MRFSSATSSAAAITALAPSAGCEECASWPWTVVWRVVMLLWASATSMPVGSPTMTARGRGRSVPRRRMTSMEPRQVVSSS
jgi:hypothetical protein